MTSKVSDEEYKEHMTNVSSLKTNVDAIASQIALIPALEMTIQSQKEEIKVLLDKKI